MALLVRHVDLLVSRAPLLALLSLRDRLTLLSTCRTLRSNRLLLSRLLSEHHATRHLFHQCDRDWCARRLRVNYEYTCPQSHSHQPPNAVSASLLSLAFLMATQLEKLLYKQVEAYVYPWTVVPFILPVTSRNDVQYVERPGGFRSGPGLHWENQTRDVKGRVRCRFCDLVDPPERAGLPMEIADFVILTEIAPFVRQYNAEYKAYWANRRAEESELRQQWRDEGFADDSDEFQRRVDAYKEETKDNDARFQREYYLDWGTEMLTFLAQQGRIPDDLVLLHAGPDDNASLISEAASDGFTDVLCRKVFRPLRAFFERNGFSDVRRGRSTNYTGSDELPRSEISSVEVIGGIAPHGFFAGVYLVEVFI